MIELRFAFPRGPSGSQAAGLDSTCIFEPTVKKFVFYLQLLINIPIYSVNIGNITVFHRGAAS